MDFAFDYSSWIIVIGWLSFILFMIGFRFATGINILGKPTIKKAAYKTGKISFFLTGVALIVQAFGFNLRFIVLSSLWELIAVIVLIIGFLIVLIAFIELGKSTRMGLPVEKTKLKINGLYKISRHPMYVGLYLLMISSVIYTLNPVVLVLAIYSILIHHRIALAEEKFLLKEFGSKYKEYSERVRRYI